MVTSQIDSPEAETIEARLDRWHETGHYSYLDSDGALMLHRTAAELIAEADARSLLDVGCRHGPLVPHIDFRSLDQYVGIDLSSRAIAEAQATYGDIKKATFLKCSWHDLSPLDHFPRFDTVYFGGVICDMDAPVAFIEHLRKRFGLRTAIVQDITRTDLSTLLAAYPLVTRRDYVLDIVFPPREWGPDWKSFFETWDDAWPVDALTHRQTIWLDVTNSNTMSQEISY